jgi:hypothetical protein
MLIGRNSWDTQNIAHTQVRTLDLIFGLLCVCSFCCLFVQAVPRLHTRAVSAQNTAAKASASLRSALQRHTREVSAANTQ